MSWRNLPESNTDAPKREVTHSDIMLCDWGEAHRDDSSEKKG